MSFQVGKQVMVKVAFLDTPCSAKITEVDHSGIWIEALEMASTIQRVAAKVGPNAVPPDKQFLKGFPVLFVPFVQIQWLAAHQ
jgi:hypothetical protein